MANLNISEAEYRELKSFPLFEGFTDEILRNLLDGGISRGHHHREILYHAGTPAESFCIVLSGAYKLIRPTPRGDDLIVYFATPGDSVGALLMSKEGSSYPVTAKAMGPSRIYLIPRSTFRKSWTGNARIQQRLNSFLYSRMSLVQDERALARSPLHQRIAALLLRLLEKSSREHDQVLPLPLTRQEIADSLGVAVESVIRAMSEWSHAGWIQTTDRQIEILRLDQIIRIVKED